MRAITDPTLTQQLHKTIRVCPQQPVVVTDSQLMMMRVMPTSVFVYVNNTCLFSFFCRVSYKHATNKSVCLLPAAMLQNTTR